MMRKLLCVVLLIVGCKAVAFSQVDDSLSIFSQPVVLDTFIIKSSFDVGAFVRRVKNDTTFYKAFRSMRLVPYTAENNIDVLDRNGRVVASEKSTVKQVVANGCRSMLTTKRNTTGKYYKRNGDNIYYTTSLFNYLFIVSDTVCNENDIVMGNMHARGSGRMERNKYELKQLIFNPGTKVTGIPFMADRASIFDEDEAKKYDFSISVVDYEGVPSYEFKILPKPQYVGKTIYSELTTWFRKGDYSILARNYSLAYSTLLYDFNVIMKVRTVLVGDKLYPSFVSYDGNWHVFSKKRERVKFDVTIAY